MARTHTLGLPRIGLHRELKFALESFWRGESSKQRLQEVGNASRDRRNVYQMAIEEEQRATSGAAPSPFMVKRKSWGAGVAEVIAFDPPISTWGMTLSPHYGNPKVFMLVKYRDSEPYALEELTGADSFAYERIDCPGWWKKGLKYPLVSPYKGRRIALNEDGSLTIIGKT